MKQQLVEVVHSAQADFGHRYWNLPMKAKNDAQRALEAKHGAPHTFAMACAKAVGDMVSVNEARTAIEKYCQEWEAAK